MGYACAITARSALKTMVWIAQGQFPTVCIIIHLGARAGKHNDWREMEMKMILGSSSRKGKIMIVFASHPSYLSRYSVQIKGLAW